VETDTQHFFQGGGETNVLPLTLAMVILAGILLLFLPRRYAYIPLLVAIIVMPLDQQLVLAGLHITMSRVLILLGAVRLLWAKAAGDHGAVGQWNALDIVFVLYCLSNVLTYWILWGGDNGALVNRLGFLYNALGMYCVMRFFIVSQEDLDRLARTLVWVFALIAIGMAAEQFGGRNVFAAMGGVPEISVLRDGQIRAEGPFVHPLTAGGIGATLMPLAFGLWWIDKRHAWSAFVGMTATVIVSIASRSSTALLTLAAGCLGIALWRYSQHLRLFRWIIALTLVTLHLVMKSPVWSLLARIDLTGSSSGYQRYQLVDQFIRHFADWWLVGIRTTSGWGWDMWDTINSYVAAGTSGGLINLTLFLAMFVVAFRHLGRARKESEENQPLARRLWIIGAMLFAQSVALMGIAFFDQSQFIWYIQLAMIGTAISVPPVAQEDEQDYRLEHADGHMDWELSDTKEAILTARGNWPPATE
jgi:hypothetical protein